MRTGVGIAAMLATNEAMQAMMVKTLDCFSAMSREESPTLILRLCRGDRGEAGLPLVRLFPDQGRGFSMGSASRIDHACNDWWWQCWSPVGSPLPQRGLPVHASIRCLVVRFHGRQTHSVVVHSWFMSVVSSNSAERLHYGSSP